MWACHTCCTGTSAQSGGEDLGDQARRGGCGAQVRQHAMGQCRCKEQPGPPPDATLPAALKPAWPPALVENGGQEAALAHALQLEAVAAHFRLHATQTTPAGSTAERD